MSSNNQAVVVQHSEAKLKLSSYVAGFGLSLLFTFAAYLIVVNHAASSHVLVGLVVAFALCQFFVQAFFFLHLGRESKPRWKLAVFLFMIGIVLILVFGSLWIIDNLNYRQTLPSELHYINSQDDL